MKRLSIKVKPETDFAKNPVCLIEIIGQEFDVMNQSLTISESTNIEILCGKKISVLDYRACA